jgi:hypothetical protein
MGEPGLDPFDLDAMCQDSAGNLYFSIKDGPTFAAGPFSGTVFEDGDVAYIPASAITYDSQGLITSIAADSGAFFAREADMDAIVANTGTRRVLGPGGSTTNVAATTVVDIGGMEIDPNGGTWQSPQDPMLTGPNIIFGSNFSQFLDNLWSTAPNTNGLPGSVAVINGVEIGYTDMMVVPDGSKFGVAQAPGGYDSIGGLAIVAEQSEWIAIESPNGGVSAGGNFEVGIGRVQPNSGVAVLISLWNAEGVLPYVLGLSIPPALGFGGNSLVEVDAGPFLLGAFPYVADANGYVSVSIPDPLTMSNLDILVQVAGQAYGSGTLSVGGTTNLTLSQ